MESKFEKSNANLYRLIHGVYPRSISGESALLDLLINGCTSRYEQSQYNYQLLIGEIKIQPEGRGFRKVLFVVMFSPVIIMEIFKRTW